MDDSVIRYTGSSIEEVVEAAVAVEAKVKEHLKLICMDLSDEKEQILGTSEELVRLFKITTGRMDLGAEVEAVNLGIDTRLMPRKPGKTKAGERGWRHPWEKAEG